MNIKYFFLFAFAAFAFASCNKAYKLNVELPTDMYDGSKAYLRALDPANMEEIILVDSAQINGNKIEFAFDNNKNIELPAVAVLDIYPTVSIFLEKGNIDLVFGKKDSLVMSGTPTNDKFNTFLELNKKPFEQTTEDEKGQLILDIINDNIDNNIGRTLIIMGMATDYLNADQLDKIIAKLPENFLTEYPNAKNMLAKMDAKIRLERQEAINVELEDADENTIQLADIIRANKYTLVDFWASWCGPCIQEMPNLKAAYDKYKDKGFEIVGISVDDRHDEWQAAIKSNSMNWLQFNDKYSAGLYGVRTIPFTMLFDSEGKLVGRDFREDALSKKLEELLGEQ